MILSSRAITAVCALVGMAAVGLRLMPSDLAVVWFLRVFVAAVLVTVAPGALTVLAWRPRQSFGVLELIGVSLGIGFAFVQLLTVAAVMYAWSIDVSLALLAGWAVVHAVVALRHRGTGVLVHVSRGEAILLAALMLLGVALYVVGSPFDSTEPRIHIALVRRLVHLASPTLYTTYLAPDIVYTYPFPGTHYMLALMARMEGIDAFFLYHKLRAFWGVAAPILLYGCAKAIFRSARIALATTFVAVGLVANGTFGAVPEFSWAQLAPLSHASDIAMGVLLPALLLLAFQYFDAPEKRERLFFGAATLALASMLIMVHPREIVQFLVYFSVFVALLLAGRHERSWPIRVVVLVVAIAAVLVVYRSWHEEVVLTVNVMVEHERERLTALFGEASWRELFGLPIPLLREYMVAFGMVFYGWTPVVLLASPFALFAMRGRPLTLLVAASIACYLLIIRFPLLGIPYVYLTYFEMLYTPVRNVIFFVHILTGVCAYLLAVGLARFRIAMAVPIAVAAALLVALAFRWVGPYLNENPEMGDLLFAPVLIGYGGVAWWTWTMRGRPPNDAWIDAPHSGWPLIMTAICLPLLVATELPESSLRGVSWASSVATPDRLLSSLPCVEGGRFCPPPVALIRFAENDLSVNSVFAVDVEEEYQPSLFMPQQMTTWPGRAQGLIPRAVFVRYYEQYDRTNAAYGEQPLFNASETRAEQLSFIANLGVTHVLVTPRLYDLMSGVLGQTPDVFTAVYDDGRWAVYEVAAEYRRISL